MARRCHSSSSKRGGAEARGAPGLTQTEHALWEARQIRAGWMKLRQIQTGIDRIVAVAEALQGVDEGDLFEARLVPFEDALYLTNAFCFHPPEATRLIQTAVKRVRKAKLPIDGQRLIFMLSKMRLKFERYRNIALKDIYDLRSWGG